MKNKLRFALLCLFLACAQFVCAQLNIYHDGWIDFNKNGKKDVFEDPKQPVNKRIDDLLSQMNLNEKTVQLATLYGYGRVLKDTLPNESWKQMIWKDGIANIDEHLAYSTFTPRMRTTLSFPYSRHADAINTTQRWFIEQTRMGIPVDFTQEGIHGLASDRATAMPAPVAMGSTWDKTLIHAEGDIIGKETRALGYTNVYVPILDLARDPRWGRVVECYGEDPFLVAELGKQMVLGVQGAGAGATLKHYAVYSVPKGGRDGNARTDPHVAPKELQELYLYTFRRVIEEAHPVGVMSSYNDWDGEPITGSYYFLTQLLRQQFGFDGYVVSDSDAVEFLFTKHHVAATYEDAVRQVVEAGLNVHTNFQMPDKYVLPLRKLVQEKKLSESLINSRVADVLRVKFKLGLFDHPYVHAAAADTIVRTAASLEISKKASREALILLKNQNQLLPLDKNKIHRILVTGPLAADTLHSLSRYGPNHTHLISVLNGFERYLKNDVQVDYAKGCNVTDANWPESELYPSELTDAEKSQITEATDKAKQSDVVIAVMGETESLVGESRSRTSLELPGKQLQLLEALKATGKPVILVLINGRALTINWANRYLPAIIEAWFPGEFGGDAIAEAVFGEFSPGGKLPVTFPKSVGQIEYNFPFKPASHAGQPGDGPNGFGKTNVYGSLYPFGYGLSYTSFAYSNLVVTPEKQSVKGDIAVSFDVTNTGKRPGDEVAQLYVKDDVSSVTTYVTQLRGFERVSLQPGETKTLHFTLHPSDLQLLNKKMQWVVEPGTFQVWIGSSSEDIRLRHSFEMK